MPAPAQCGTDPALDALFAAVETHALPLAEPALFLRARDGAALRRHVRPGWQLQQSFKPAADALRDAGLAVAEVGPERRFAAVLALPPRQRDEARALLARMAAQAADGALLLVSIGNDDGARSLGRDLERLAGPLSVWSKHHCRVYWTRRDAAQVDAALCREWLALDALRTVEGGLLSRPGLFAWDRIDPASALLAAQLPATLAGRVADLGAGHGFLACALLRQCPGITALDLYEAEARALDAARANTAATVAALQRDTRVTVHWHDVCTGLPARYDAIVSNPPFHLGRADRPDLGRAFIAAAADALLDDGALWLVANRHLPYEATLQARFASVTTVATEHGFKVLHARGPRR
jgi:16S rRNA (guanine1207-N2)-methyltransferase